MQMSIKITHLLIDIINVLLLSKTNIFTTI